MTAFLFVQILCLVVLASTTNHMISRLLAGSIDDDIEELGAKTEAAIVRAVKGQSANRVKLTVDAEPQPSERG